MRSYLVWTEIRGFFSYVSIGRWSCWRRHRGLVVFSYSWLKQQQKYQIVKFHFLSHATRHTPNVGWP